MKKNKSKQLTLLKRMLPWIFWTTGLIALGYYIHSRVIATKQTFETKKKMCGVHKKMLVYRDSTWHEKQKKYTGGMSVQSVTFTSVKSENEPTKKITRHGMLLIEKNAPATILICHGFMTSKDDMGIMRHIFKGYNVMTFDFRAHGENVDNQCCTLGYEEMYDVIGAAQFLKTNPDVAGKPLIVYGFSMGAVASIMAQRLHPELFDCAIWDCPFDSTEALIGRSIDRMKLSLFGYDFMLPGRSFLKRYAYHPCIQEFLKSALKAIASMDATKIITHIMPISPKDAIKDITIPVFLIACHNDEKAPPSAVLEVYKNASSAFKRCWIASGRKHFDALFANPEKYIYIKFTRLLIIFYQEHTKLKLLKK